jgi:alkanesulfonate monooxygenase SsuD/methylene tetrahydromethanopterin reductase-like flavin-dependent oxidoreductase (luciferase family)
MHVGYAPLFQNPGNALSDAEVYAQELRLAEMAEPLGFDSVWSVEHHFTDYTMCPDVLQFLSYMAGKTQRVKLGSMVVVLPWHDPVRVAEEFVMLDNLSDGRVVVGVGRGLARVEYAGFRLDMNQSRTTFNESAEMLVRALEEGYAEFDGEFVRQPRVEIRPNPFKSFEGRTYAAAISPESSIVLAKLGVGVLIIPQKPWHDVQTELASYRGTYQEVNEGAPPAPVVVTFAYCDNDEERATEMSRKYVGGYWDSVMKHYEFRSDHLKTTRGYEYYGNFTDKINTYGDRDVVDFFVNLQVTGTPEQCYQKVMDIYGYTGTDSLVAAFSYGGMPFEDAEASMRLFASEVMPELKKFEPTPSWG